MLFQQYCPENTRVQQGQYIVIPSLLQEEESLPKGVMRESPYHKCLTYKQSYRNPTKLLDKLSYVGPCLLSCYNQERWDPNYALLLNNETFSIGMTVLSAMVLQPRLHS